MKVQLSSLLKKRKYINKRLIYKTENNCAQRIKRLKHTLKRIIKSRSGGQAIQTFNNKIKQILGCNHIKGFVKFSSIKDLKEEGVFEISSELIKLAVGEKDFYTSVSQSKPFMSFNVWDDKKSKLNNIKFAYEIQEIAFEEETEREFRQKLKNKPKNNQLKEYIFLSKIVKTQQKKLDIQDLNIQKERKSKHFDEYDDSDKYGHFDEYDDSDEYGYMNQYNCYDDPYGSNDGYRESSCACQYQEEGMFF